MATRKILRPLMKLDLKNLQAQMTLAPTKLAMVTLKKFILATTRATIAQ